MITFDYTDVINNYFVGRHAVDDNNKQRVQPISLEETRETLYWENRVFAFFLALSASNAQYAHEYFAQKLKENVLEFRQKMAKDLIIVN